MNERKSLRSEKADLFRSASSQTPPRRERVRGFERDYWMEFAKPPRVISARTVSPTFLFLMCFVPCPT